MPAEIDRRFLPHPLNTEQVCKITEVREKFIDLGKQLLQTVPQGRELQTALTHLESASFFAIAGISRENA